MNDEILLEVKPKYIWWLRIIERINIAIYCTCVSLAIFISVALYMGLVTKNQSFDITIEIVASIISIILGIAAIISIFDKKNFEVTNYKVYNDRIEFEEGFINHKYTTIQLIDIKEIHLEQNFFQRKAELGSINFVTAANNSTTNTGVYFRDIENSKYVYAKVKEIHGQIK